MFLFRNLRVKGQGRKKGCGWYEHVCGSRKRGFGEFGERVSGVFINAKRKGKGGL